MKAQHVAPAPAFGPIAADHLGGVFVFGAVGVVLRRRHGPSLLPSLCLSLDWVPMRRFPAVKLTQLTLEMDSIETVLRLPLYAEMSPAVGILGLGLGVGFWLRRGRSEGLD